ncbi:unnamed protein product [Didymodactylos carnosus]|uniref:THAP-type domain-containing protein n=1 Tax=Didymodactylos carnosus TaxID=1234261 RepID=A0A814LP32_9BILA|nr:unnamed protein product [Didymodactylos carnosus]CAF3834380.1 unnamed protein product [Didymodactylos carnosus]
MHHASWFDSERIQPSKLLSNIGRSSQIPHPTQLSSSAVSFSSESKRKEQSPLLKLNSVVNSRFKPKKIQNDHFSLQNSSVPTSSFTPLPVSPIGRENYLSVSQITNVTSSSAVNVLKNHCAVINCTSQYSDKQKHFYFVPFPSCTPELEQFVRRMKINSERLPDEPTGVYICSRHRYPLYLNTHRKPGLPIMPTTTHGIKNGIDHVLFLPKPWHTLCCMKGCINNDLVHRLSSATFVRVPRVPIIQRNAFLRLIGNTDIDQDEFVVCDRHFPMSMRHNNILTSLAVPQTRVGQMNQKLTVNKLKHTSSKTMTSTSFEQQHYIRDKEEIRKVKTKSSECTSPKSTVSSAQNVTKSTTSIVNYSHPYDCLITSVESSIDLKRSISSPLVSTTATPLNPVRPITQHIQRSTKRSTSQSKKYRSINTSTTTMEKQQNFIPSSPTSSISPRYMLLLPAQMQSPLIATESTSVQSQNNFNCSNENTTYSLAPSVIYPMQKKLRTIRPNPVQDSSLVTTPNFSPNNSAPVPLKRLTPPSNSLTENLRIKLERKRTHTGQHLQSSYDHPLTSTSTTDINQWDKIKTSSHKITTMNALSARQLKTNPTLFEQIKTNNESILSVSDRVSARVKSKRQRLPKRAIVISTDNEQNEVTEMNNQEHHRQRSPSPSSLSNHSQSVETATDNTTSREKDFNKIQSNEKNEQPKIFSSVCGNDKSLSESILSKEKKVNKLISKIRYRSYKLKLTRLKLNCELIRNARIAQRRKERQYQLLFDTSPILVEKTVFDKTTIITNNNNDYTSQWLNSNNLELTEGYLSKMKFASICYQTTALLDTDFHLLLTNLYYPDLDKQTECSLSSSANGILCNLCRRQYETVETFDMHLARKSVIIQYLCVACNLHIRSVNPCQAYYHLNCHTGLQDLSIKELVFEQLEIETQQYFNQFKIRSDDDSENEKIVSSWKNNTLEQKSVDDHIINDITPMEITSKTDSNCQSTIIEEPKPRHTSDNTLYWTCMLCKLRFGSRDALKLHMFSSHKQKQTQFEEKEVDTSNSLNKTMNNNRLNCQVCNLDFTDPIDYNRHIRRHGMYFLQTKKNM